MELSQNANALSGLKFNISPITVEIFNATLRYFPSAKIVFMEFYTTLNENGTEVVNSKIIGDIPTAYRPKERIYMTGFGYSDNAETFYPADVMINPNGKVTMNTFASGRVRGCGFWFLD